jgi:hypothetical protein
MQDPARHLHPLQIHAAGLEGVGRVDFAGLETLAKLCV